MRPKSVLVIYFIIICSCYCASIPWNNDKQIGHSSAPLDAGGALVLRWRADHAARRVRFSVALPAAPPRWLALGFSDRGELVDTDVCLFWTDYQGRQHYEDMHGDGAGRLRRDASQDCENFRLEDGCLTFERRFDTCDDDDYVIEDGTTHLIWARGDDQLFTSSGLCLPCAEAGGRGFTRARLLTPPPPRNAADAAAAAELRVTHSGVRVPAADTTYWCKVVELPAYIAEKEHHIVQYEAHITKGSEGLVHHMEVFYCAVPPRAAVPRYEGGCSDPRRPDATRACSKVKAAWAMGAPPFTYPAAAGLPLGGPRAARYVMLEVHYNNPQRRADYVDSSGIVLRVTSRRRRHDAAIMELGLEYTDKMAVPAGQYAFALTGHCVPQCTGVGLPQGGVTVFASQLHTHLAGVAAATRHARAGRELPPLARDPHYSTHFQEIRLLLHPRLVLPGDYLQTTCVYRTTDRDNATVGGLAITDEMCVNYLHYYPAAPLEVCKSAVQTVSLDNYFRFEQRFDNMVTSPEASPRDNYLAVRPWTPLRAQALHSLYAHAPLSMQCNKSDGTRFQGEWEGLPIPQITTPLAPEPRKCH